MPDGKVIYEIRADHSNVDSDLDQANEKVKSGGSKISGTIKKLAIGTAVVGTVKEIVSLGSAFESSMAGASTLFGDVEVDIDGLNDKMLELSDSSGIAAEELGNTLYNALSAGVPASEDMSEAMDFMEKSTRLAKAGFTDVDTAMSATIKTMNAYGMGVEETDRIQKILMQTQNEGIVTVDELGGVLANVTPTAAAMGVSFEQVGAGIANMTAQGTPAAQATTQLNSLFAELGKQGTKASDSLAEATKGTKYAGMSFQDMMAAGVPLNEVLDMMGDYADENNIGMLDMFSSIEAGKAALANGGENSAAFAESLSAMSTETDVVGEAFDKVSDTSGEKFNKAMNQLKNAAIELFLEMIPLIAEILPVFSELLKMIIPPVMELATVLFPVLVDIFKALAPPIMQIIDSILPPLTMLLKDLSWIIQTIVIPVVNLIGEVFAGVFGEIATVVGGNIKAIETIFRNIIGFVKNVFTGNWKGAWKNVKDIFGAYMGALGQMFKFHINAIIGGINGFIRGLNKLKIPNWVPIVGGKGINLPTIPRLRVGLDYVPEDEFPAMLHKGEAVLTASEAGIYRSLGGNLGGIIAELSAMFKDSSGSEFSGVNVTIDKVIVRNDEDPQRIAREIYNEGERRSRAKGGF